MTSGVPAPRDSAAAEPVTADPPPLPQPRVLRQRWADLAYFHWPFAPEVIQATLPPGTRVDTFDGVAWVGLVPFVMRNVRVGPTPPIPYFGTFVEINVRTYVVDPQGQRSVWFYSLDVPRAAVVGVARTAFALPYCWAATRFESHDNTRAYAMRRRWPRATPDAAGTIAYQVGEPVNLVTELDHFLTARWSLLTTRRRRLRYGRVHHERWPLHEITDYRLTGTLIEAAGLPSPEGPPHTACSPGVNVDIARLQTVHP